MSTRIVNATVNIIENTIDIPEKCRRLRMDEPRNAEEEKQLNKFKIEVEEIVENMPDDYFLLRYLRARKHNIKKAKEMYMKYLEYRKTCAYLEDIKVNDFVPMEYITEQLPVRYTGNDHDGRPVFWSKFGRTQFKHIFDNGHKDDLLRYAHYVMDWMVYAAEKQWKKTGVTHAVGVVDLDGLAIMNAFHVQSFQVALYLGRIFEAYHPEMLYTAIAINANWMFTTVYNTAKHLVAEETAEKVQIYGRDTKKWSPVLRKYIPEESIPSDFGGKGQSFDAEIGSPNDEFKNKIELI